MTTKVPIELSSTPGIVDNSNATAITIDSSELVGIGTSSPVTHLHLESSAATQFRIRTTSSSSEPQMIMIDGAGDYFAMQKVDRGMTFKPQGAEEVRIDADGLKFNGDTAAANALDDYEQGTWTPTLPNGGTINTNYSSKYTKIGNVVYYYTYLLLSFVNNSSRFQITLPFNTSSVTNETYPVGAIGYSGTMNTQDFRPHVMPNSNPAFIYFHEVDGSATQVTNATMYTREPNQNGSVTALLVTGWYYTD